MKTVVLCLLSMFVSIQADEYSFRCWMGFVRAGFRCYVFTKNEITKWADAFQMCSAMSTHLAMPKRQDDFDSINRKIKEIIHETTVEGFWIGATKFQDRKTWRYVLGDNVTYVKWAPGEPDNTPTHDCAVLTKRSGYLWENEPCGLKKYGYICQY